MEAIFKAGPLVTIKVEGDDAVELFESIAKAQEAFEHDVCGCCQGANVKFVVRTDDQKNNYYELHCLNLKCRARLVYGQSKKDKGHLYPKRRWDQLSDGEKEKRGPEPRNGYLANNGWYKYVPQPKTESKTT